eukprot:m.491210 g.491210  ORF g.491210 m.491210 type:complete len:258 (+) comp29462_c0_seq1:150-923(+)
MLSALVRRAGVAGTSTSSRAPSLVLRAVFTPLVTLPTPTSWCRSFATKKAKKKQNAAGGGATLSARDLPAGLDLSKADKAASAAVTAYKSHVSKLRISGQSALGILDTLLVKSEPKGPERPLEQLAQISAKNSQTLHVNIYDASDVVPIEQTIADCFFPMSTSRTAPTVLTVTLPKFNHELREKLSAFVKSRAETFKVRLRKERQKALKQVTKHPGLSKDDAHRGQTYVQQLFKQREAEITQLCEAKQKEIESGGGK